MQRAVETVERIGDPSRHTRVASRAGSTDSMMCRRSSSPICDQRAISAVVRWQPSHRPSASSEQTPTQGLSTARNVDISAPGKNTAAPGTRRGGVVWLT